MQVIILVNKHLIRLVKKLLISVSYDRSSYKKDTLEKYKPITKNETIKFDYTGAVRCRSSGFFSAEKS